jgi:surface polysaccharide O-acyltransferase-like enzyme
LNRNHRLDLLRAVAIIAVIIIHTFSRVNTSPLEIAIAGWLRTITRPTIAIFLFVSGMLFAKYHPRIQSLVKRYKRILIPYTIFSICYLIVVHGSSVIDYVIHNPLRIAAFYSIGQIAGQYYFVFVILYIYLMAYFVLNTPRLNQHLVTITILFCLLNLFQGAYFDLMIQNISFPNQYIPEVFVYRSPLYWPVFFFLGMCVQRFSLDVWILQYKHSVRIVWLVTFAVYTVLFLANVEAIDGYNSIIGTLYSFATICALFTLEWQHEVITFLSRTSYYIYLCHIVVLELLHAILMPQVFSLGTACYYFVVALFVPIGLYFVLRYFLRDKTYTFIGA